MHARLCKGWQRAAGEVSCILFMHACTHSGSLCELFILTQAQQLFLLKEEWFKSDRCISDPQPYAEDTASVVCYCVCIKQLNPYMFRVCCIIFVMTVYQNILKLQFSEYGLKAQTCSLI